MCFRSICVAMELFCHSHSTARWFASQYTIRLQHCRCLLLTKLQPSLHATVGMIHGNRSFLQTRCAVQFAVVCVQLAVSPTHELLVSPTVALADTLCHPAAHLAFPPFAAVLNQTWICETTHAYRNGIQWGANASWNIYYLGVPTKRWVRISTCHAIVSNAIMYSYWDGKWEMRSDRLTCILKNRNCSHMAQ
jgi:hypothetical protein